MSSWQGLNVNAGSEPQKQLPMGQVLTCSYWMRRVGLGLGQGPWGRI